MFIFSGFLAYYEICYPLVTPDNDTAPAGKHLLSNILFFIIDKKNRIFYAYTHQRGYEI